jgi:hypothetical protein
MLSLLKNDRYMQFSYAGIQLSLEGFQKLLHGGGGGGWL